VGRALHRQWTLATADRAREAQAAAVRMAAAAAALRSAADRYAAADDAVARRLAREA